MGPRAVTVAAWPCIPHAVQGTDARPTAVDVVGCRMRPRVGACQSFATGWRYGYPLPTPFLLSLLLTSVLVHDRSGSNLMNGYSKYLSFPNATRRRHDMTRLLQKLRELGRWQGR